jgi:hypothetical protein
MFAHPAIAQRQKSAPSTTVEQVAEIAQFQFDDVRREMVRFDVR